MTRRRLAVAGAVLALTATACVPGSRVPESMSIPPPTFTTPPAPPKEKHVGKFPTCEQLAQQVPGLPPLRLSNTGPNGSIDLSLYCDFLIPVQKPEVSVFMMVWRNREDGSQFPPEVGRGRSKARDTFASGNSADDGPADELGVGEKAKWQVSKDNESCYLIILDENAVLELKYVGVGKPDSRSEECRGPLRALAKPFYDALQPR